MAKMSDYVVESELLFVSVAAKAAVDLCARLDFRGQQRSNSTDFD